MKPELSLVNSTKVSIAKAEYFTGLNHHIGDHAAICSRRVRSVSRQYWRVFRLAGMRQRQFCARK
jgi:hypothetical protein